MRFLAALFALAAASPLAAQVAQGNDDALMVTGVQVDVGGKSAADARQSGWREAQRLAWTSLWARLTGKPAAQAPRLADSALDSIVEAIEVEQEQAGPSRYIARLSVVFDRSRTAGYVGDAAGISRSPPFLVMPVLQDAGARFGLTEESPWRQAWSRLRGSESVMDYVRIQPSRADAIWLSAWAPARRDIDWWQQIAARYQVADVISPELILERTYAGGPVSATLIARGGIAGTEFGRVRLTNRGGDVDNLMDAAVRAADAIYVAALREGRLRAEPELIEPEVTIVGDLSASGFDLGYAPEDAIEFRVATPDLPAWTATESFLRTLPGVGRVRLVQLQVGGESVARVTGIALDALRYALFQRNQTLAEDDSGLLLRPRLPTDPIVEPPLDPTEADDAATPGALPDGQPAGPPAGPPPAIPPLPPAPGEPVPLPGAAPPPAQRPAQPPSRATPATPATPPPARGAPPAAPPPPPPPTDGPRQILPPLP